jgi:hypothetical protein
MRPKIEIFKVKRTTATSCPAFGGQHMFFYLDRDAPDHPSMWVVAALLVEGPLDVRALETSLRELVRRHSVFRTGLVEVAPGELIQRVLPPDAAHLSFELTDLSRSAPDEQERAQDAIVEQLASGSYDLAVGPGLRCHVGVLAPDRNLLALAIHHVASDGTGVALLHDEIGRLMAGESTDERPLCFIDFADSVAQWTESSGGRAEREYWRERLAGAPPLELPVDHPRAAIDARRDAAPFGLATEPMAQLAVPFSDEVHAGITRMASAEGTTAHAVYLAALASVLSELTGQTDLSIECVHNHRMGHPLLERVHGNVGSTRVMRIDATGAPAWPELARRAKQVVGDAYRRSWVPVIDLAHHSIRRVLFNYIPTSLERDFQLGPNLRARMIMPKFSDAWRRHWDLQLLVLEQSRAIVLFYSLSLFEKATAQMILDRYVALLTSAA